MDKKMWVSLVILYLFIAVSNFPNNNVTIFRNVPYAQTPMRFARPKPPAFVQLNGHGQGNEISCPQFFVGSIYIGQEDCLYLDIYTPSSFNTSSNLPVFAWIYGGAYQMGSKHEFGLYDATHLVSKYGYVFVAMNYRLGPLGFLASPLLQQQDRLNSTGNVGLLDQQVALEWIQKYIYKYGGDPKRVSLVGESAGAFSICWHLVNSRSWFAAAILESGQCDNGNLFYPTLNHAFNWTHTFSKLVGCNFTDDDTHQIECLRQLPVKDLLLSRNKRYSAHGDDNNDYFPPLYPMMPWAPVINHSELLDIPYRLIQHGNYHRVPTIVGTNQNEADIFIPSLYLLGLKLHFPLQWSDVEQLLGYFFQGNQTQVKLIMSEYGMSMSTWKTIGHIFRDYLFICPARRLSIALAKNNGSVWSYQFDYQGDWIDSKLLGDYHSSELEFVFDNAWPPILHSFSKRDQQMANVIGLYWSSMVKFHNPNAQPLLKWPTFNESFQYSLILNTTLNVRAQYNEHHCTMWDSIFECIA